MLNTRNNLTHLLFKLQETTFAINSNYVIELHKLPHIVRLPHSSAKIPGVTNLRGKVIPIFDLRAIMGKQSYSDEKTGLIEMLKLREQDHKNWLLELENSVREDREFTLQIDPHKCKFGIWYNSFSTDDFDLSLLLKKFDDPHRRIHALADKVEHYIKDGYHEKALSVIELSNNTILKAMLKLFDESYKVIQEMDKRLLVVIKYNDKLKGLIVDSADSTVDFKESMMEQVQIESTGVTANIINYNEMTINLFQPEDIFND